MPDAPLRRATGPAIAHWLVLSCACIFGCAAPLAATAAPAQPTASSPAPLAESAANVTFRVHATREGLVGGTTSSGHVITPNDHFVALPCTCALNKYVRLSFNGKSQVVPVYDVGPWNNKDDYWMPSDQRYFKGLPRGVPQATAAYTDKHNNGQSGMGDVVTNPTGVDIGDGTWYELGLTDTVDITFLWLTDDPTGGVNAAKPAASAPAPAAKSVSGAATTTPAAAPKSGFDVKSLPVLGVSDAPPLDSADPLGTGFTYVSQTKHNMPDVIAKYWKDKGGVPMFGYPLSEVFVRKANGETHVYQYFERVLFEYLPDTNGVALAPLGSWFGEVNGPYDTADPFDSTAKKRYVAATQHSIGGGILQWYAANGDADMFGAPISEEMPYTTPDGRKVTAQLFERARIEMDANGTVTLGRLGAEWLSQRGWL
jgi:hypothetical protein